MTSQTDNRRRNRPADGASIASTLGVDGAQRLTTMSDSLPNLEGLAERDALNHQEPSNGE